ncbi:MAG: protein kinase domain-containing protein [Bryobacteraceae bacterium]
MAALGLCLGGATYSRWGLEWEYASDLPVSLNCQATQVSLAETGTASGARREGGRLLVWNWAQADGALRWHKPVSLAALDTDSPAGATVALSPDGTAVAWPAGGSLRVDRLTADSKPGSFTFERRRPVASLVFTGNKRLVAMSRDGQLDLYQLPGGTVVSSAAVNLKRPSRMLAAGSYIAVLSDASSEVVTYSAGDTGRLSMIEYRKFDGPLSNAALSDAGRVAVAASRRVLERSEAMQGPGVVRAIAYNEAGELLAAGEFEGVYRLAVKQAPKRIAAAPASSVTALAMRGPTLVVTGPKGASLAHVREEFSVTMMGYAIPAVFGLFLLVGLLRAYLIASAAEEEEPLARPESPNAALPAPEPPEDLLQACRAGECVLYAGAGLSASAGHPVWDELVRRVLVWAGDQAIIQGPFRDSCFAGLEDGHSGEVADRIIAAAGGRDKQLRQFICSQFETKEGPQGIFVSLRQIPFAGFITTNYDLHLERAFPQVVGNICSISDSAALTRTDLGRDRFLLKLYGSADRPESVLFSPSQYSTALADNPGLFEFMVRVLTSRSVLFLGASLDGIESTLRGVALERPSKRSHYALVHVGAEQWQSRAETLKRRYGITVIPYLASDSGHPEARAFIAALGEACGQTATPPAAAPTVPPPVDMSASMVGILHYARSAGSPRDVPGLVAASIDSALHPGAHFILTNSGVACGDLAVASSAGSTSDSFRIPSGDALYVMLAERKCVLAIDGTLLAGLEEPGATWLAKENIRLAAPILGEGEKLIGALLLAERNDREPYGPREIQVVEAVAAQIAVIYEKAWLQEQLRIERSRNEPAAAHEEPFLRRMMQCPECNLCFDFDATVCPQHGEVLHFSLPIERVIDGKYRMERLLGSGGMGAVFEASDLRLGRRIALKILLGDVFRHSNALERFSREAQAAARLNHPNIIRVYDYGSIGSTGAYLVMELIDGLTWRSELKRTVRIPPHTLVDWCDQLLDGIGVAHEAGIVHRDLKPENVFIGVASKNTSLLKILDFGLAKMNLVDLAQAPNLTMPGSALGTMGYMPPEQLAGGRADERSDLFSIGMMVIESLTGVGPREIQFRGDPLKRALRDRFAAADLERTDRLAEILDRSISFARTPRYAMAREFHADLIPALASVCTVAMSRG